MRRRALVTVCWISGLAGCGWTHEQRQRAQRLRTETEFVILVASGNTETVGSRLRQDPSLANARRTEIGAEGDPYVTESALTQALQAGQRPMVKLLLEFGADPNRPDGKDQSPLDVALSAPQDRHALVSLLLDKGAGPEMGGADGQTALHQAAQSSMFDEETFELLLAKASGTGGSDARGWTALHSAAGSANVAAIRRLAARGANPNARTLAPQPPYGLSDDVAGATPLALVARDRQIAAAAALCALGADPDLPDVTGASARMVAARDAAAKTARDAASSDTLRHRNMAAFLARGGGCDGLRARLRAGERLAAAEVDRIAYESECETGWGWACGQAGWAYSRGEGVSRDDAKALAFFRRGCETPVTPHEWSCGMTGIFHVEGLSVAPDPAAGAQWLIKGCSPPDARRSDAQSCYRLGRLHASGRGVPKDIARARALLKKACDARYEGACADLERYGGGR